MVNAWWTNKGMRDAALRDWTAADLRALLVTTAPASTAVVADLNFVADVVANEAAGTGYGRKTLATKTLTEDDTNDRVVFDADDPSVYSAANFGTPQGAYVYRFVATDADHVVWLWLPITTPIATNTGDFNISFDALGLSIIRSA